MQLVMAVLREVTRLDAWLYRVLGAPYGVLLSIGLVIEIGRHVHELVDTGGSGSLRHLLPLALDVALLLHTAGALQERLEHRQARRTTPARRD